VVPWAAAGKFQPEFEDAGALEEAQEVGFAGFRVEVAGENRGDFVLKFVVPDLDAYVG